MTLPKDKLTVRDKRYKRYVDLLIERIAIRMHSIAEGKKHMSLNKVQEDLKKVEELIRKYDKNLLI